MATPLYLISTEADSGKSAIALALFEALARRVARPAVFRPVTRDGAADFVVDLLLSRLPPDIRPAAADCVGVTYTDRQSFDRQGDEAAAREAVVERYRNLARHHDGVLVVGSDFTDVGAATELDVNVRIALDLAAAAVVVISGRIGAMVRSAAEIAAATEHALDTLGAAQLAVIGIVANRVDPGAAADVAERVAGVASARLPDGAATAAVPELALLAAPTLHHVRDATGARLLRGTERDLDRVAARLVVAAMTVPHVLDHLDEEALVIFPGDRSDVLVATLAAARSRSFPVLSGVLLTGGFEPEPSVARLIDDLAPAVPVLLTDRATFEAATTIAALRGRMRATSARKIDAALGHARHVPTDDILDRAALRPAGVVTPLMFIHDVVDRAVADRRHIVLPEGTEARVLAAAQRVLRLGVADLTLLGQPDVVAAAAAAAGVDVRGARIIDPATDPLRETFADTYTTLRAHRGMTREEAWQTVADVSYFGTLLVRAGLADGMVSGAAHTTAHTIRPSFEIIKTRPGVDTVSSVFFMLLPDRVLVYGDCAVVPDPTPEQLADIAVSSAETAAAFGVQPRIAMLSYSTGTSGSGAEVEKVRAATDLVRRRRPDLAIDGPLQYDAAVDPAVAATKLPDSPVAGRATVLVFPDLNTGNNTYKAVQRSSGAVAVGPVLQGLRMPVNDLSRGASVDDITTTIAVTAVQAQAVVRP